MNKQEFLRKLSYGLSGLPQADIEERLAFYSEMIDDRIEEGLTETEAVSAVGTVEEIVGQTLADTSLVTIVKEKIGRKKRLSVLEIVLLVLGAPLWLPLLIAALVVVLSLYISVWSVIISLWACFASVVGCAVGGVLSGIIFIITGYIPSGIAMIAAGIICAGLSIFAFFGCKAATKGIIIFTKKAMLWTKRCFVKKEAAI